MHFLKLLTFALQSPWTGGINIGNYNNVSLIKKEKEKLLHSGMMKCDRFADSGILEESSFLPPGPSSISFRVKWKYGSEISGRNRICHRMKWVLTARNRSAPPELSLPKSSSRTLSNHHPSPTTLFASLPRQPRRWGRGARPVEAGRGTRGTAGDDCHRRHWMPLCRSNTHGPPRGGKVVGRSGRKRPVFRPAG